MKSIDSRLQKLEAEIPSEDMTIIYFCGEDRPPITRKATKQEMIKARKHDGIIIDWSECDEYTSQIKEIRG